MTNIVTLADVRTHLRIPNPTQPFKDDGIFQYLINAADRVIEFECGDIIPKLYSEFHDGGDYCIFVRHLPLLEVVNLEEGWGWINYELDFQDANTPPGESTSMFAYAIDNPEWGQISRRTFANVPIPFMQGESNIQIQYKAGEATIPGDIFLAELELIAHWYQNSMLRSAAIAGTNISYDSVQGAIYSRDTESGTQNINIGVPYRILELIKSHRHTPFFA